MAGGADVRAGALVDVGTRTHAVRALTGGHFSGAEDVGGRRGRTLWWEPWAGTAYISQVGGERRELTPREHRFIRAGLRS